MWLSELFALELKKKRIWCNWYVEMFNLPNGIFRRVRAIHRLINSLRKSYWTYTKKMACKMSKFVVEARKFVTRARNRWNWESSKMRPIHSLLTENSSPLSLLVTNSRSALLSLRMNSQAAYFKWIISKAIASIQIEQSIFKLWGRIPMRLESNWIKLLQHIRIYGPQIVNALVFFISPFTFWYSFASPAIRKAAFPKKIALHTVPTKLACHSNGAENETGKNTQNIEIPQCLFTTRKIEITAIIDYFAAHHSTTLKVPQYRVYRQEHSNICRNQSFSFWKQ